jgi:hypothetical protein
MNAPGHYLLNLALLGKINAPNYNVAVTLGAIVPDAPIFIFYLVAKFIYKLPERQIWSQTYYEPFWQNFVAWFDSFPIATIAIGVCFYFGWQQGVIVFASLFLHSVFDFPVHHNDAHRHFFPFSNYRFLGTLSYWDRKYHAQWVALAEMLLAVVVTPMCLGLLQSNFTRAIAIAINILYVVSYWRFYVF